MEETLAVDLGLVLQKSVAAAPQEWALDLGLEVVPHLLLLNRTTKV